MRSNDLATSQAEIQELLELTARVGNDSLLTQASTGNTSIKLGGNLWIKASGKWMADAMLGDILTPLSLREVMEECLQYGIDPAERYPCASLETAMHAILPHRVVLHVHSVNTIAWAVRSDAPAQLEDCLKGLRWQWVPYVASGLPLSRAIQQALSAGDKDVFVLGNHGLAIAGENCSAVENLLREVERRVAIRPRQAHPADYTVLSETFGGSEWELPDDDGVHALGTDAAARTVLSEGLLYPCQAIFSNSTTPALFRPISCPDSPNQLEGKYRNRPFLIIHGCGVVINKCMTSAERAMISGLAQVVQRIQASAPLRYLTEAEVESSSSTVAYRYRELASEPLAYRLGARAFSRSAPGKSLAS